MAVKKPQAPSNDQLAAVLPETTWWKSPQLRRLNFCLLSLIFFSSSNGYDGSLVNGLQSLDTCVWIGIIIVLAGSILGAAAPNATVLIISRVLVGLSAGWTLNAPPLLINEMAYPSHRSITSALFMVGYYLGAVISSWVTFATRTYDSSWSWRLPSLLQMLLPLVAIPGFIITPESPRWLIGRDPPGDQTAPLITYEVDEIKAAITAEKEAEPSLSYVDMIKTPGNRHRLLITVTLGIISQWAGNGVVSYYLALLLDTVGITETKDQLLISACLQVWNLIFGAIGATLVDRAGIMLVSYTIITGLSGAFDQTGSAPTGTAVIPDPPMLTAYPCEIWPFALRSRGLSVAWLSANGALIFNIFRYYFVFVAILVCYAVISYFFYPETKDEKGLDLPRSSEDDVEKDNPVQVERV
ncbi:hypothetical protein BDV12DRAFT_186395 [Aspergillus spectabilis]